MKSIPTILVSSDPQAKEFPRNKAAIILRANRMHRTAHRIDGKLSKAKTYAVNYFSDTATIRIEK